MTIVRCGVLALSGAWLLAACAPPPPTRRDAGSEDAGPPDSGPRPDAGVDAGTDAGPCSMGTMCGADCVDVTTDSAHCGACDNACTAPADASAFCASSTCEFACDAGFVREGALCVEAPRPIWPPSLSTVRSPRPTLRWALPGALTEATLELCGDAACVTVHETLSVTGEEAAPSADLAPGVVFWRITSGGRAGPTWRFDVAVRDSLGGAAWGIAPDYNRDGFGDVAVGAPFAAGSTGRVAVHLGSSGGTSAGASAVLIGTDGEGAELGLALACAGDLDGDGFADLAVGSPGAGAVGRVYVFFGSARGIPESGARIMVLEGPGDGGTRFGGALAGAGDVDGDGYGDLVVSAIGADTTPGRMHLYLGRRGGVSETPALSVVGVGRFAGAVAGAGDLDGDGYSDVAVGAYAAGAMNGEVRIFRGGPSGLAATPDWILVGTTMNGQLGYSVAGAGDLNGDGFADLAVSAPNAEMARGHVLVFYGGASGPSTTADAMVAGINSGGGFFGHSVSGLGDGNGDGFDDLAVGAFGVNDRAGRVSVFLGAEAGLVTSTRTTVEGPFGAGGDFGWAIASAGDVDRNGRFDLVVGAPGVDARNGRAYVYRGAAGGIGTTATVSLIGAAGGAFGRAVAGSTR